MTYSAEQAIGQYLDKALSSVVENMVNLEENSSVKDEVTVGGVEGKSLTGTKLSDSDMSTLKAKFKEPGNGAGLYTKTASGKWIGTHTMEGMLQIGAESQGHGRLADNVAKTVKGKTEAGRKIVRSYGQ